MIMMNIDEGDVIKLSDGDIHEVTGALNYQEWVYYRNDEGEEVQVSFIDVDVVYKPQ